MRVPCAGCGLALSVRTSPAPDEEERIEHSIGILRSCGVQVKRMVIQRPAPWKEIIQVFCYGMQHDLANYLQSAGAAVPVATLAEIVAFNQSDLANRAPFGQDLLERSRDLAISQAVQLNWLSRSAV